MDTAQWWQEPIVLFTLILTVATVGLFISTTGLWVISIRTARRQLRAYLGIDDTRGPDLDRGPPFRFHYFVANTGQTPAYKIRNWTGFTLGPYPLVEQLPDPQEPAKERSILGNNGRYKVVAEIDQYTTEEILRIKGDDVRLYVFGKISYVDAFGNQRSTRFKMMYGGRYAEMTQGFIFCEDGNEAN